MKRILWTMMIMALGFHSGAAAQQDTVYIELGNTKKAAIVVRSKEDLKALEQYDLNKIISELDIRVDTVVFKKKDKGLRKYEKGGSYYFHIKRDDVDIKLGNVRIELECDDIDDLIDLAENYDRAEREEVLEQKVQEHRKGFDMDLGINGWTGGGAYPNADLISVKPWGSWYVAIKRVHKVHVAGRRFVSMGYGVSWYNWKFDNRNTRITMGENGLIFSEDNSVEGIKSKLTASYVNFEFIPMIDYGYGKRKIQRISSGGLRLTRYKKVGFRFGIGPYIGYRLGSKTKIVFRDSGSREKDKVHDNFYLSNLRYGLRAQLGYKRSEFFINYDLNKVFHYGRGPNMNAITFGLIII